MPNCASVFYFRFVRFLLAEACACFMKPPSCLAKLVFLELLFGVR